MGPVGQNLRRLVGSGRSGGVREQPSNRGPCGLPQGPGGRIRAGDPSAGPPGFPRPARLSSSRQDVLV
ncbi:hypothetical protein CO151_02425 [bacterium CG_4_9_14_3_um_filter_65_15]|nr:MAG: hypothetical protein CO151_02425 [bacterium CG_4_9_14_3_um_filter_65_15]